MARRSGKAVILAVDDEPMVRTLLSSILSRSYKVISACEGNEALVIMKEQPVDLVLTDIAMPGLGGLPLADQIQRDFPDVPIAFLSAYIYGQVEQLARRRSPHILRKPFEVEDVTALVDGILERGTESETAQRRSYPFSHEREMAQLVNQAAAFYEKKEEEKAAPVPPAEQPPAPSAPASPLSRRVEDQLNVLHLRYDLPVSVQKLWIWAAELIRRIERRLSRRKPE